MVSGADLVSIKLERFQTAIQLTKLQDHANIYSRLGLPVTTAMLQTLAAHNSRFDELTSLYKKYL